ncbi:MAG TPA: phage holin family protein [Burkholderiales bacterium]|nr:phage holin family protein [Burkholderiales bacterium]
MAATAPIRAPRRSGGLADLLGRLAGDTRELVTDYALLAALDARRAAIRLALLLGAVLVAAVLLVTAWMALVAGGIVYLLGQGASWITALAVAALINLAGAAALAFWSRRLVVEVPFTALVRQLRAKAPQEPS